MLTLTPCPEVPYRDAFIRHSRIRNACEIHIFSCLYAINLTTGKGRWRVDNLSRVERSEIMSRVRSKNTRPEQVVRKLTFALGYRYRLHAKDLPGRPDLVFRKLRKTIFVHGCFWHRHGRCALARLPKSRKHFWIPKLEGNHKRDQRVKRALKRMDWNVPTIWECQLKDRERLRSMIRRFLNA